MAGRSRQYPLHSVELCPVIVVEVSLGHAKRIEVTGEPIVSDRLQNQGGTVTIFDFGTVPGLPIDLFVDSQPRLCLFRHGEAVKENHPAPDGNISWAG